MSLLIPMSLIFLAVAGLLLAVGLLVIDLRRREENPESLLGVPSELEVAAFIGDRPKGIDRWFYELVETSGSTWDGKMALAWVVGLAIVGAAIPLAFFEDFAGAAAGLVAGVALPLCWWSFRRARRLGVMQRHLADTLEMVADELRGGQTLEQAAQAVSEQAVEPLRTEFAFCVTQLRLGQSPLAVLTRMARRIPLPEFKIFATAVLVHRQTGGNLALLADRLAHSARDRDEIAGHVRAVTAGSRFSVIGVTLGTLIGIGMLASMRPEYVLVFRDHPLGPQLVLLAAGLWLLGVVWIWRVLKVSF